MNYTAARLVWGTVYIVGVFTLVIALVTLPFAAVFAMNDKNTKEAAMGILAVYSCLVAVFSGLVVMALSDIVLAVVDTARNSRDILNHLQACEAKTPSTG